MGFECVDNNLLGLINELHAFFVKYYSAFISAGKALGALMVVFVVAGEAYKVMVKHQAFDVLANSLCSCSIKLGSICYRSGSYTPVDGELL